MPTVSYLKHEIRVDVGTSSCGEVAWCVVDGKQICFLGGEAEARRFLRERKMGERFGPRQATWSVELLDSGSSSVVYTAARARETAAYFAGRPLRVVRRELCPVPGCDGSERGEIKERTRRGFWVDRPCPCHVAPVEIVESGDGAAAVELEPAPELRECRDPACRMPNPHAGRCDREIYTR